MHARICAQILAVPDMLLEGAMREGQDTIYIYTYTTYVHVYIYTSTL